MKKSSLQLRLLLAGVCILLLVTVIFVAFGQAILAGLAFAVLVVLIALMGILLIINYRNLSLQKDYNLLFFSPMVYLLSLHHSVEEQADQRVDDFKPFAFKDKGTPVEHK